MGIIKAIFQSVKQAKAQEKLYSKYKAFSNEQLLCLNDDELRDAINIICDSDVDEETLANANAYQRTFLTVWYLDAEVNNGGLCQFFVNSSRAYAPYVSGALEMIGAFQTKKLFDEFVAKNNIDLENLDSFISDDLSEFQGQYERYPFDDFDNSYYEVEEAYDLLLKFVRENINQIVVK